MCREVFVTISNFDQPKSNADKIKKKERENEYCVPLMRQLQLKRNVVHQHLLTNLDLRLNLNLKMLLSLKESLSVKYNQQKNRSKLNLKSHDNSVLQSSSVQS